MEKSPQIFHSYSEYIHKISEASNTGINLNLLQNFIFIPVDIFLHKLHNEGIKNKLDAWLTFLSCDEPKWIIELINNYPEFKPLYSHLYDLCRNIEGVMNMFSKELEIMDRNTVKYMIDELQEQLDNANEQLENKNAQLKNANTQLEKTNTQLEKTNTQLLDANKQIIWLTKLLDDNGIKH